MDNSEITLIRKVGHLELNCVKSRDNSVTSANQKTRAYYMSNGHPVHFANFICHFGDAELADGLASVALTNARTYPDLACQVDKVEYWISGSLLVFMGGWTVYLVMLLKSLIFNVYHVTLTAVRLEWEKPPQKTTPLMTGVKTIGWRHKSQDPHSAFRTKWPRRLKRAPR